MNADALTIRRLETIAEYRACEDLQIAVWGLDPREIVCDHVMLAAQRHGGLTLGAFAPGGWLAGALFGFLGVDEATPGRPHVHISHIMGVHPHWQGKGVGYRLKLAQRDHVRRQGLALVMWTYDPLESRNAALNIGKLGACAAATSATCTATCATRSTWACRVTASRSNGGSTRRACARGSKGRSRRTLPRWTRSRQTGSRGARMVCRSPAEVGTGWEGGRVSIEIPAHFQQVRKADGALALAWRLHTCALFEAAFAAGYAAVDFASPVVDGVRRSYYILEPAPGAP
ncbi:MAG: hypothetical protein M5R40_24875 [Anaerolineae bacterium]|nr:hypothetical protein [Anaerolineae bacterium]